MRSFGAVLTVLAAVSPFAISPAFADPPAHSDSATRVDAARPDSTHATAPALPPKAHQAFDILRQGDKIGSDALDIDHQADATTVKTKTNISVKVMFIEAYRYEHNCSETWKNGQLTAFKSQTDDNGTKHAVEIAPSPTPDKLTLIVDGKKSEVSKAIAPASLWSKELVTRTELFDPADGKLITIAVKDLGDETLTIQGVNHKTRHFKLSEKSPGDFDRDLWFEGDSLVRMKMIGSDHSTILSDLR
ncbi:MAG: DUF6134 family protein [Methylocella sp.]